MTRAMSLPRLAATSVADFLQHPSLRLIPGLVGHFLKPARRGLQEIIFQSLEILTLLFLTYQALHVRLDVSKSGGMSLLLGPLTKLLGKSNLNVGFHRSTLRPTES